MPSNARPDLVGILEAAYAVERDERAWLAGLIEAIRPSIDTGLGIFGYVYDTNVRPFQVRHLLVENVPVDEAGVAALTDESNDEFVRSSWLGRSAMMASETPGFSDHPGVTEVLQPVGIHDILVVNALDPIGVGCWIGAPVPRVQKLDGPEREQWNRVAAHVRASLRLRLRLALRADTAGAEAVMTKDGKIEHLEAEAEPEREALRQAALGISRARTVLRREPHTALSSWKALVQARWTLVDEFWKDGEQYVVARVNAVATTPLGRLSQRELQVVACLSMGLTNKEIAYELGLSASTVRVLVTRAYAKLGARTREDLVAAYRRDTLT